MPVTISVVNHPAVAWTERIIASADELFSASCPREYHKSDGIIQTSFTPSLFSNSHISPSENGFVWAAYHAYSSHHHLVIRPEDVWFAILTQLSFFINAHAEELRAFFVPHQGKKVLEVLTDVTNFGAVAMHMTRLMAKHMTDPEFRDWVMPSFTTTTDVDQVVGAVLFMGAMQSYFVYKITITCGIPSVTLLGEVADWRNILKRLDKLDMLGEQPRQFAQMLRPILQYMIRSFEEPTHPEVIEFWNTIVHHNPMDSGTDYLSGWLTAFCFWNAEGEAKRRTPGPDLFAGVKFPRVNFDEVPAGFASVPVMIDDDDDVYATTMTAGSVGIAASVHDPSTILSTTPFEGRIRQSMMRERPARDTIQPVSGWWITKDEPSEQSEARIEEMRQLEKEMKVYEDGDGPLGSHYFGMRERWEYLHAY